MEEPYEQLRKGVAVFLAALAQGRLKAALQPAEAESLEAMAGSGPVTPGLAFTACRVLNRHAGDLRRVGFNVDTIPPVTVRVDSRPVSGALRANSGGMPKSHNARPRTIGYNGELFEVSFEYNPALNEAIKALPGKGYNPERRVWLLPLSQAPALKLFAQQHQFQLSETASRQLHTVLENVAASYAAAAVELDIPLKQTLMPFQTGGVAYALRNRRVIIADQMGLGKTIQAIAAVTGAELFPCLVICPKSLRYNWQQEWGRWTSRKAHLYSLALRNHLGHYVSNGYVDVAITHFEGMKKFLLAEYAKPANGVATVVPHKSLALFKSVIIDEAHEFRNPETERFGIARHVTRGKAMVLLLTGTPVVNTVADLGALLELAGCAEAFGGMGRFRQAYADINAAAYGGQGGREGMSPSARKLRELNIRLRATCFIRREKHQVLKELPDKTRQVMPVEIDNRPDYAAAEANLYRYLEQFEGQPVPLHGGVQTEMLARIGVLKRLSARGKLYAATELIHSILAAGEKVVVFCWHLETIDQLASRYPAAVAITGRETDEQVEAHKRAFQAKPHTNVLLVTYKRGGTGHTLTAASKVVFLELGWNPKDQDQAEDRLHRIGAKAAVNCYYLLGRNTIDEYLYEIIQAKRLTAAAATGGTEQVATESGVVAEIIKKLRKGSPEIS